jgi:hypothetical protein
MIKGSKSEISKNICKLKALLNSSMITGTNLTAPKVLTLIDVPSTNKKIIYFFPYSRCQVSYSSLSSKFATEKAAVPAVHLLYCSVLHGVLPDPA